jgi:hypothetical protein
VLGALYLSSWGLYENTGLATHFSTFKTTQFVNSPVFWNITMCSLVKVNLRIGGTYHSHFWVEEQAKQETNMKEESVDFHQTTQR